IRGRGGPLPAEAAGVRAVFLRSSEIGGNQACQGIDDDTARRLPGQLHRNQKFRAGAVDPGDAWALAGWRASGRAPETSSAIATVQEDDARSADAGVDRGDLPHPPAPPGFSGFRLRRRVRQQMADKPLDGSPVVRRVTAALT